MKKLLSILLVLVAPICMAQVYPGTPYKFKGNLDGTAGSVSNVTAAQITAAGDLLFTNRFQVFTNTTANQNLDLGALIRSLPVASNKASGFGGGKIQLSPGAYFTSTNGFVFGTPFMLEIAGSGCGNTAIVLTNWDGRTPALWFSSASNNYFSPYIHDLWICTTLDKTNFRVAFTNASHGHLARVAIGQWSYATNANGEVGGDYGSSSNAIGLRIYNHNGQQWILDDVAFPGNLFGADFDTDHLTCNGYLGLENCWLKTGQSSAAWGTNLYSIGGGIIFSGTGIHDDTIIHPHTYDCAYPFINNMGASFANQVLIVGGDTDEGGPQRSLTIETNNSGLTFSGHQNKYSNLGGADKILTFSGGTWTIVDAPAPNVASWFVRGIGSGKAIVLQSGGNELVVSNNSAFTPSLINSNFTAVNMSAPPLANYFKLTISGSTNVGINGVYEIGPTNGTEGYMLLTNGYSSYMIVIQDPTLTQIELEDTNDIGSASGLQFFPTGGGGTDTNFMAGPWTDLNGLDNNIVGTASISYSWSETNGNFVAESYSGNGSGLTNLNASKINPQVVTNNQIGPIQFFGDANKTNAWYYSNKGVLTSNAAGVVNISGSGINTTKTITPTNGIIWQIKKSSTTNFMMTNSYQIFCLNGTNQAVALVDASTVPGQIFRFSCTNGSGNFTLYSTNGQTIRDGTKTNLTHIGVGDVNLFSDGAAWWLAGKTKTVLPNASWSTSTNINVGTTNTVFSYDTLEFNNSQGIALTDNNTAFSITNAGQYFFTYSAVVTNNNNGTVGYCDIWLQQDGTNYVRSRTRTASSGRNTAPYGNICMTVNYILNVSGPTSFKVVGAAESGIGIGCGPAISVGQLSPAMPSIIVTINKVSDSYP